MKRILLTIAIIASIIITACTKPETPIPEPEPESYMGYLRSEHPNIKIPGISINDKIIYDLKSAISMSGSICGAWTSLYSGRFTYLDVVNYDIPPMVEIYVIPEESRFWIHISKNILYDNEVEYEIIGEEVSYKTDNIQSIKIKEAEVIIDKENLKTDICKFDIEITIPEYVIEIIYYGNSHHREIYDPIPVHP